MALPITVKTDYIGKLRISLNNYSSFEDYISQLEPQILNDLLGADNLYNLKNDSPLKDKYTDLLNGGYYINTEEGNERVYYRGLKEFLLYMVYANFMKDSFASSIAGLVSSISENSQKLTGGELSQVVYNRYNYAVHIYEKDIYPFLYFYREISTNIDNALGGVGNTTLEVTNTKYLYVGDTVFVDGEEYEVDQIVTDTSIICLDPEEKLPSKSNFDVSWKPFYDIEDRTFKSNQTWL